MPVSFKATAATDSSALFGGIALNYVQNMARPILLAPQNLNIHLAEQTYLAQLGTRPIITDNMKRLQYMKYLIQILKLFI